MKPLKEARRAVGRGAYDEALVQLWNSLEPARIAGDRGELRQIESLADLIANAGDEAQRREAGRLLDVLHERVREEAAVPATSRVDADLSPEGEAAYGKLESESAGPPVELEELGGRGSRIGTVIWLLIVLAVIIVNVLEQAR